ncbi:MAG: class I SAM-dependent methyltransferase [Acidimicrobiales bacterium]
MDPHRRSGLRPKGPPRPSPVAGGHSPCWWWPLAPGAALDVGCGEGADAIWLAGRGWDVTALDVSEVALQPASVAAEQSGVHVRWLHVGLVGAPLSAGT